jgi:tetratricopeptide (TPR) repeat protein
VRHAKWFLGAAALLLGVVALGGFLLHRHLNRPAAQPVPAIDLTGAEEAVRELIESSRERVVKEPNSAHAWGMLAEALLANGYDDEAMPVLERAAELAPGEPRWPYLRARRLLTIDRTKGSELLEHAVALAARADPRNVSCKLLLAEALCEQGDYPRVVALAREVLAVEPDNGRAHFYLGCCDLQNEDLRASLDHLLRAAESPHDRKRASRQLASVALRLGDEVASQRFTRQAKELPDDVPAPDPYAAAYKALTVGRQERLKEADRLEAQRRYADSVRVLREVASVSQDTHSGVVLGVALIKLGDNEGAEKVLLAALEKEGVDSPGGYYALAVAQTNLAKHAAAERSALRAVAGKPDHANAHWFLGKARLAQSRRDEAIADFRRAVACRPELAGPHLSLGEALAAAGQREEARQELQLAVDLAASYDPSGERAREALERLDRQ